MFPPTTPPSRWDIFCKVVDNFGDIGVCWRLARQLADEQAGRVRLWVDDLALAQRFAGDGHPQIDLQYWHAGADFSQAAPVVLETFGCGLPEAYQQAMQGESSLWINIDYLSAEPWVEGFHAQPSPQPNGLVRYFFYPGFTAATGGLLRERDLPPRQALASWQSLGITPVPEACTVSLFCYHHAPLRALADSLHAAHQPVHVLVPESVAPLLSQVLGGGDLAVGDTLQRGLCQWQVIPFLSQTDYDQLLTLCDLNFVRGEDSWIRALWAAKPLIWLPYQQTEDTHLIKLQAFLARYLAEAPPAVRTLMHESMQAWAQGDWSAARWSALQAALPALTRHAQAFAAQQMIQRDLVTNLVIFIEKCRAHRV